MTVFTGGVAGFLDILQPSAAPSGAPVVLYVHGGGWHEGDRGAGMHPWLNPLLAAHGYVTASVTYRLSGEAPWPAQLHDVRAAVRWLRAYVAGYGGDPDRIGLWGHSAGAHLAAMAALTMPGDIRAVALSACPSDLRGEPIGSGNEVARLIGETDSWTDTLAAASPVCHVHPDAPPFLLAHGTDDAVVAFAQSVAFRDVLVAAGVEVAWVPVEGAPHEWADLPAWPQAAKPADGGRNGDGGPAADRAGPARTGTAGPTAAGRPTTPGSGTAGTFGDVALPFFDSHLDVSRPRDRGTR